MDEENDVLDWGAEDEENKNQDTGNNGATALRLTAGDNDDAEDAVSLGDEEETQDFYLYQQEDQREHDVEVQNSEVNVAPPFIGADDAHSSATPGGLQRESSSISQAPSSNAGTPRRNSSSGRRSPQPALAPRITHALPPKPVVTNVPFLPPSHPSIVEATAMSAPTRTTGRSESHKSKVIATSTTTVSTTGNGKGLASGIEQPPLPRDWEAREARSGSGGTYYYNVRTHESTWTRPVSNSSSSSPSRHFRGDSTRRRRGSDSFLEAKSSSPRRSDHPHSQSQEQPRNSRRAQPLNHDHVTDPQIAPPPNPTIMSYNDRHYRPGAGTDNTNAGGNTNVRHHRNREEVDPRFNPRPDQAFTPSPEASPRARERARSPSPLPMSSQVAPRGRDSRSNRHSRPLRGGRNGNTDTDSSTYRDRDSLLGSYPARDSWDQNDAYQESRRHPRHDFETSYDASLDDSSRPPMPPRNGTARGRRGRDHQPMREEGRIPPDSRTRSPHPDKRDTNARDEDDETRDHPRHWPMPPSREHNDHQPNPVILPQLSAHPHLQRKRDRPSRFGQQPTSMTQQLDPLPTVKSQTHPHRPMEEDDPFVPDDIRSPPTQELLDEKLSSFQASIQTSENVSSTSVSYRQVRQTKRLDERADLENVSSSEQPRHARPPLPPQAAEFLEVSNRPRDRPRRFSQPSLPQLNDQDGQPALTLRNAQGPTHDNISSGTRSRPYGQNQEDDYDEEEAEYKRERNADMAHLTPDIQETLRKDVEYNIKMRRIFTKALDEEMARDPKYPGVDMGPPMDIRRSEDESPEPVNYPPGQMYAPRGPRAMHSSINQNEVPMQTGFGPGGNRERSPPPHMGGRGRGNSGWREERGGRMSERGGRRDRGRSNEYPRPPPPSASGPNSVPMGGHRKSLGNSIGGSGLPTRMPGGPSVPEMSEMNQKQMRGGGGMKGDASALSHPPRELQYDRAYFDYGDRYRPGKPENDGPLSRRRDSSLPPFERQPLSLDTTVPSRDGFLTSPPADPSRLARTWTPRGEAPPEVFRENGGTSGNDRRTTSPSILRSSPHLSPVVDTGRSFSRYADSRDRPGNLRGRPLPSDGRSHQAERFVRQPDEPRRSGGLEGRLGDRLDDPVSSRQTQALAFNLDHSVNGPDPHAPDFFPREKARRAPFHPQNFGKYPKDRERQPQESSNFSSQSYAPRESDMSLRDDGYNTDVIMDGPPHLHPKVGRDEPMGRKRRQDNRPERRPGSLLERLEMSGDGIDTQQEPSFSRSLSERVQVPLKRDRDELVGDRYGADDSFGVDGTDPVSKKPRRKTPRGRKRMAQQ